MITLFWILAGAILMWLYAALVRYLAMRDSQEAYERMQDALETARVEREEHEEYMHRSMQWLAEWRDESREIVEEFSQIKLVYVTKLGDA